MENVFLLFRTSGLNKFRLEKEIGLPRGSISNWNGEIYKPSIEALLKISNYFGVSIDYLVGKEKPESPYVAQGMSISLDGKTKHFILTAEHLKLLEQLARTLEEQEKRMPVTNHKKETPRI